MIWILFYFILFIILRTFLIYCTFVDGLRHKPSILLLKVSLIYYTLADTSLKGCLPSYFIDRGHKSPISLASFGVIPTAMAVLKPISKSKWIFLAVLLSMGCLLPYHALAHGGDDHGDQKPNLRARGLIAVKIWCLIIVFLGTFAGGISPFFCRWNESLLMLGTQFAGGVFMGTALMHFLSD
jgi:hypothetical protein